jgi:MtN3 and saliva related transmembrane protein
MSDWLGWVSSIILLATIVSQISKQWRERSGKGISRWLFVGQTAASIGFTIYSALLENWVFTITNAAMAVSAIVGWAITVHFKRQGAAS